MSSHREPGWKIVLALATAVVFASAARAGPGLVWTSFPADRLEVEATSSQGAAVTYELPTAVIGDRELLVTCKPSSGSMVALGETAVVCVAAEPPKLVELGSRVFKVVVRDTTAPTFSDVPDQVQREAAAGTIPVVFELPKAKDVVSGIVPVTCSPGSGSGFSLGRTTVTCTAKDGAGNRGTVAFGVRVVDTVAPALSDAPDVSVEATATRTPVTYDEPRAVDAVDGTVPVACTPASGSEFPLGQVTVACSARDGSGNDATTRFRLSVVDTTPPALVVGAAGLQATSRAPTTHSRGFSPGSVRPTSSTGKWLSRTTRRLSSASGRRPCVSRQPTVRATCRKAACRSPSSSWRGLVSSLQRCP